jgi:hypothetical protein
MPRFYFRLEAADGSGNFREGTVTSPTVEEAQAFLVRAEQRKTDYRLTTVELDQIREKLDELGEQALGGWKKTTRTVEEKLETLLNAGVKVAGEIRAKIATHAQAHPYTLVYLSTEPPARDRTRRKAGDL